MSSSRPELKFSDKGEEAGFLSFYKSLPSKPASLIRLFERGDYYSAHGDDAQFIAQSVYRTTSVIKYLEKPGTPRLPSVTLAQAVFNNFLKDALLNKSLKIEIYGCKMGRNWTLLKKASPGNLQDVEDLLGNQIDQNPVVLAVKVQSKAEQKSIGICFIDASARKIGISEFADNELFSNFESMLIQLGVKECVLQGSNHSNENGDSTKTDFDAVKIIELLERCDIPYTERKSSDFNTRDIEQDLARLLPKDVVVSALPQLNSQLAMASTAALIKYLGLMTHPDSFNRFELIQHDLGQYMRLDSSAMKALNLMPGPRDGVKTMSLFGLLNHCKTVAGTRLLARWLKQPLMNIDEIETRHLLVEAFVENSIVCQTLREDQLQVIPDINRLVKKLQRGVASLEDVVRLYQMVIRLPDLVESLENIIDEKYQPTLTKIYVDKIKESHLNLEKLQELVETTVDLQALDNHEFIIKPDFDDRLREIRTRLEELKDDISREHLNSSDDLNMDPEKKLKLENHNIYGWCMRVTRTDGGCLRNKREYIELSTQKAGIYFTTRNLRSLGQEFTELTSEYNKTQSMLVKEVVGITSTYCPVLEELSMTLAHLDVIVSFAHVSSYAPTPYVRPKMHPRMTGNTILKEARHPCLEMQADITFIPNDVSLVRDESEFLIITGPNMGGKSTYIRQIGVIALMAQIGCFVPCTEAELTIFDSILARVGAGDSQLKGVSTFMAEMLETATILKSATKESLIVIDELGRGTSTYDGFGLAWAISEHIINEIGCFSMFATHFHELTALADKYPTKVCNLHVVAHVGEIDSKIELDYSHSAAPAPVQDITLLYKVERGVSSQSFGIHVAEVVQFPPKVVRMAKRKALELEDFSEPAEVSSDDAASRAKHVKLTTQEIREGSGLLDRVLKKWATNVKAEGDFETLSSTVILQKLKGVIDASSEKAELESNKFIKSLMAEL